MISVASMARRAPRGLVENSRQPVGVVHLWSLLFWLWGWEPVRWFLSRAGGHMGIAVGLIPTQNVVVRRCHGAQRLRSAPATVEKHVEHILRNLQVRTRAEATARLSAELGNVALRLKEDW